MKIINGRILKNISCPVCGANDYRKIFNTKDYRIGTCGNVFTVARCSRCGFMFLNPRPLESEIVKFYPKDFHRKDETFLYKLISPCFNAAQASIVRLFKKQKPNSALLDIGCGNGGFMLSMQRNGYEVFGVELNLEAAKYAPDSLKGRILYKDIKECNFTPKSFDIITCFQSLEHIFDLEELFGEIRRIMKDDGILYICVPNMEFFEARLFGPYYYNLEVPRHLYFFTQESIRKLLLKNGFVINRFIKESFYEIVSTPASFYHGLWNFAVDRKILIPKALKLLTFFPLVFLRGILRIIFIFDNQNLKLLCSKV